MESKADSENPQTFARTLRVDDEARLWWNGYSQVPQWMHGETVHVARPMYYHPRGSNQAYLRVRRATGDLLTVRTDQVCKPVPAGWRPA